MSKFWYNSKWVDRKRLKKTSHKLIPLLIFNLLLSLRAQFILFIHGWLDPLLNGKQRSEQPKLEVVLGLPYIFSTTITVIPLPFLVSCVISHTTNNLNISEMKWSKVSSQRRRKLLLISTPLKETMKWLFCFIFLFFKD